MSSIAAQDPDPESLSTGLINTVKPPRYRWQQIKLVFRAQTAFYSIVNTTVNTAREQSVTFSTVLSFRPSYNALQTHDAGEVAEISSHVSLRINSEGCENRNCSTHNQLLDNIAMMVKKKDLASLNEFGGVHRIELELRTHLGNGIQDTENLCQTLPNTYCDPQFPEKGFFHFLLKACNDSTIFLLFLCAVLSLGFGIKEEGPENGWYDGVTTFLAVLILVSTNSVGSCWRARKMKKLSEKKKIICEIIRDGDSQKISISDVKVGDIICLTMGDQVPADGLFVDGESLILDDMPDSKIDAQNPFVLSGTEVIKGQGRMLATSVGKNTAWSEMMSQETQAPNKKTPLQAQLDKVNKCIQIIALLASALILVVLFLRYKLGKIDDENGRPEIRGKPTESREMMNAMERIIIRPRGPISTLATSFAVCLVGLQEGLSFVLTLCIAYWNKKAASNKATVQELLACVNMGLVTTICTEKIGGPMLNQLEVDIFKIGEEIITKETVIDPAVCEALCHGISTSVMAPHTFHSSIENSLIHWAESKFCTEMESLKQSCTIIETKRSNSDREICGILMKKNGDNGKNMLLHWKGHAATILAMCSHYYDSKGDIKAIDEQRRMVFKQMIENMEAKYPKTIALAHKQIDVELLEENNLIFIGLLSLKNKKGYLEETIQAMKVFTNAGVNIKVVSGNNVAFREIIANECGMLTPNSDRMNLEGEKFRSCTDEERKEMVDRITMMENANPFDKVLLVRDLRQKGHVVAVVGVGTNDMLALKEADVGLTMETGSTKMARESSAIIWDGSFEFLVMFLMYGRCVYNNIQKFIQVELTMVIAGLLIISITTTSLGDAPITTIELFWVNLIVPFQGGLALLTEPVTERLMNKPPVGQTEPLITKAIWRNIVAQVLYQTAILVTFQFKGQATLDINDKVCKTMIFNSFVLCQVFNKFNAREPEKKNVFKGIKQNYLFCIAVGTAIAFQVAFIMIAGHFNFTVWLNCVQWVICFLIGMVPLVIDWAVKCIWDFIRDWIIGPLSSHIGFICMRSPTPSESASVLELPLINGESMAI